MQNRGAGPGDRRPGGQGGQHQGGGRHDQRGRSGGPGRNQHRGGPGGGRREDKLIDEKEIQKKIQETQAKLSGGGGKGKGMKARLRREKRQEMADAMGDDSQDNKL